MKDIIDFLERIVGPLPQLSVPRWALLALTLFIMGGTALATLCWAITKIAEAWTKLQELIPRLSSDQRRRARRRQQFSSHVQSELQRLDNLENWQDFRFTELEAEIEAEGRRRGLLTLLRGTPAEEFRREKSLSRALHRTKDRLVLVEGEPGSGKSVALRHLARKLATAAVRKQDPDAVVPLYINLKDLDLSPADVGHEALETFLLQYINRANRHDIDEFLEEEFQRGLQRGSWLFLFDSFDEIPAVLSAIEPNAVVHRFANAIADFMSGMNQCRGVVASRVFRGPKTLAWPRFRILRLSDARQRKLIRNIDFDSKFRENLLSSMYTSSSDIRAMSSNPMFLGLLCEHVRASGVFPQHSHSVFESYFQRRLSRDESRMRKRFELTPGQLMETAEAVAFVMTASLSIGLSPTRAQLRQALHQLSFQEKPDLEKRLDALEYLKLARSEAESVYGAERPFTFAHRRFQEYFATRLVMREVKRTPPLKLLTDGRWRETVVVLLQTQTLDAAKELLDVATELLKADAPDGGCGSPHTLPANGGYAIHVLAILQDSFAGRVSELPAELRQLGEQIILAAARRGTLSCEKQAVENAGVIPQSALEQVVNSAFDSGSRLLQETGFQQLARLATISQRISTHVLALLRTLFLTGQLQRDKYVVQAQLSRITDGGALLQVFRLLLAMPKIDVLLHVTAFVVLLATVAKTSSLSTSTLPVSAGGAILLVSLSLMKSGLSLDAVSLSRVILAYTYFIVCMAAPPASMGATLFAASTAALAMLWQPLALSSASAHPHSVRPLTWAILPLLMVGKMLRRFLKFGFLHSFASSIAVAICLAAAAYVAERHESVTGVFVGLAAAGGVIWIVTGLARLLMKFKRYVTARWMIHSIAAPVRSIELNALLGRCSSDSMRSFVVREVRLRRLLVADHDATTLLTQLASELDNHVRDATKDSTQTTQLGKSRWRGMPGRALRTWARSIASQSLAEARRGLMDYRDEIYRFREQLADIG